MCAASGRTNYRYGNQERCFVHDKLSHKKVAKESNSMLPNTEFGLCAETKQRWWDMKGYNVVTGAVPLQTLHRLVQWDPARTLTMQTGWCCVMSSREHSDCFATLFWIGFTRRKNTKIPICEDGCGCVSWPSSKTERNMPHSTTTTTVIQTNPQQFMLHKQPRQRIRGRNLPVFLFFFFLNEEKIRGKMQRWSAVCHLIRLPLHHSTLGLWGTLTADSWL